MAGLAWGQGDSAQATLREVESSLATAQTQKGGGDDGAILEISLTSKERQRKEMIENWTRQAEVAAKTKDFKTAESYFLQVLACNITDAQRRDVLLEMARLFEASKEASKQAAVLEKFGDAFPEDAGLPQVFIKLGMLYREMGLYKLALARFYSVLNFSLRIDQNKIESYRRLSIRAQTEIADTYFAMAQYEDAIKFYTRLRLLNLEPEERAQTLFQTAYSYFLLKNDPVAISNFEAMIRDYPQHERIPEAMFFLSNAYVRVGRNSEASKMVLDLLKYVEKSENHDEKEMIYWQKRAGNELANEFFNQGDFSGALVIYQSMLSLGSDAVWKWPIQYQIGMCFERLGLNPKAQEAYKLIVDWPVAERQEMIGTSPSLASLYDMAKWRVEHIDWKAQTNQQLEKLMDKSTR